MDDATSSEENVIENWTLEVDLDRRYDGPKLRLVDERKSGRKRRLVADLARAPDIVVRPFMPDRHPWTDLDEALGFWVPNLWGRVDPAEQGRQEAHKAELLKRAGELIALGYMESKKVDTLDGDQAVYVQFWDVWKLLVQFGDEQLINPHVHEGLKNLVRGFERYLEKAGADHRQLPTPQGRPTIAQRRGAPKKYDAALDATVVKLWKEHKPNFRSYEDFLANLPDEVSLPLYIRTHHDLRKTIKRHEGHQRSRN